MDQPIVEEKKSGITTTDTNWLDEAIARKNEEPETDQQVDEAEIIELVEEAETIEQKIQKLEQSITSSNWIEKLWYKNNDTRLKQIFHVKDDKYLYGELKTFVFANGEIQHAGDDDVVVRYGGMAFGCWISSGDYFCELID